AEIPSAQGSFGTNGALLQRTIACPSDDGGAGHVSGGQCRRCRYLLHRRQANGVRSPLRTAHARKRWSRHSLYSLRRMLVPLRGATRATGSSPKLPNSFSNPRLRTAFAIFLLSKTAPPSRRCQHGPTKFDRSTRNAAVALRKHPDPS